MKVSHFIFIFLISFCASCSCSTDASHSPKDYFVICTVSHCPSTTDTDARTVTFHCRMFPYLSSSQQTGSCLASVSRDPCGQLLGESEEFLLSLTDVSSCEWDPLASPAVSGAALSSLPFRECFGTNKKGRPPLELLLLGNSPLDSGATQLCIQASACMALPTPDRVQSKFWE